MSAPYPWQSQLLSRWQQSQGHAYILAGAPGLGKLDLAKHMAARYLCATQEACGHCKACQLLASGSHPDFFYLTPETRQISVDQIRQMNERAYQTSQFAAGSVVLIYPAEQMTLAASNALLKTLEEPSGQCRFLLVSHRPQRLPATIRSRCQWLALSTPAVSESLAWLQQQLPQATAQDREFALWLNQQRPLHAQQLLANADALQEAYQYRAQLAQLALGQQHALAISSDWQSDDLELQLEQLYLYGYSLIYNNRRPLQWPHVLGELQTLPAISSQQGFAFIEQVQQMRHRLDRQTHPNAQLVREHLLQHWQQLYQRKAG